ncbi:hypothetical protein PINS_up014774 [Pythium insidiosum]|nr:hypothetical protein PINS_up014774 [Pythium insidiosum]
MVRVLFVGAVCARETLVGAARRQPQRCRGAAATAPLLCRVRSSVGGTRGFLSWLKDAPSTAADEQQERPIHVPVMLDETVSLWAPTPLYESSDRQQSQFFVDGTTGFGGHSQELLRRHPNATLLCIDRDPEVLAIARANLAPFKSRVVFHEGSYASLDAALLRSIGFPDEVDGICVDLGANSFHFDEARRGFSVMRDGPLDMRFNQRDDALLTAATVVNTFSEVQLTRIFRDFGEERLAKEYAKAIVRDRDERGVVFQTTADLRECIERIARKWQHSGKQKKKKKAGSAGGGGGVHPATKCFQALRIFVNDELTHVATGVEQLVAQLAPHGRLATIAFHSLEDRPIKLLFRRLDTIARHTADGDDDDDELHELFMDDDDDGEGDASADAPSLLQRLGPKRFRLVKRKAIKAKDDEVQTNPRSRSARLRCIERTV